MNPLSLEWEGCLADFDLSVWIDKHMAVSTHFLRQRTFVFCGSVHFFSGGKKIGL